MDNRKKERFGFSLSTKNPNNDDVMPSSISVSFLVSSILIFSPIVVFACTNFLVSPKASLDGDVFITYNNDGFGSWPSLWYSPARDWPNGTLIRGRIPQKHTFNVVHLVNEFQVSIGETTWLNMRPELEHQTGAIIDYGLLMQIVLQRSKSAVEVIKNIGVLLDEYGYSSTGETFSIADKNEVWIMEVVGKGNFELPKLGAVWVARKVPDGYVSGHANQARIRQFPLDDPKNCIYHPDTIDFARKRGWYTGPDKDFSFSDVYSWVSFESARWCEARVYDMFSKVTPKGRMDPYLDYAQGKNLTNRMPLWVLPEKKMCLETVIKVMRSHYEGTYFDMVGSFDVGNQPFHSGDRFLPLKWKASNGKTYVFERPISIQKTGISIVSQLRSRMPNGIGAIEWFSFDDTNTNCYVPMYSSLQSVPDPYTPHGSSFSFDSAFWITNLVANYAYYRYDKMSPVVKGKQSELEEKYRTDVTTDIDPRAIYLFHNVSKEAAYELTSSYSHMTASAFVEDWKSLFGSLFMTFFDSAKDNSGYDLQWYDFIAEKTGDHFLYLGDDPL